MRQPANRFDTVIVRFGGEIGIKAAWTRKLYERRLIANIKAVLKRDAITNTEFVRKFGRLYIKTKQAEKTAQKLSQVFGLASLSPALETTSDLMSIVNASIGLASQSFKKRKSFAVRCHRVGDHPYTSQDICRRIGHEILATHPKLKLRVDLTHPEQTLHIEVREDKAYVFTDITKGAGGLPLGTQPKTICLLKGDLSSAVACWMTMKRGCPPILVHFQNGISAVNQEDTRKAKVAAKTLLEWATGFPRSLYVIQHNQDFIKLIRQRSPELASILSKRFMIHVARRLAEVKSAEGIVTGESLTPECGHTLQAFRMQDEATRDCPIYRPLLGLNLQEIKELAEGINLKEAVFQSREHHIRPKKAKPTETSLENIKSIEEELNTEKTVENTLKMLKVLKI